MCQKCLRSIKNVQESVKNPYGISENDSKGWISQAFLTIWPNILEISYILKLDATLFIGTFEASIHSEPIKMKNKFHICLRIFMKT